MQEAHKSCISKTMPTIKNNSPPPSPPAPKDKKRNSPYRLKKGHVLQAVFKGIKDDAVHATETIVKSARSMSARSLSAMSLSARSLDKQEQPGNHEIRSD
jgi:hypothetical protein